MTSKEYLSQAYRLDQKIDSSLREVGSLRKLQNGISSPAYGTCGKNGRTAEAPFEQSVGMIMAMEETISAEVSVLLSLKKQMRGVIGAVPDTDERMVLSYRYLHGLTWEEISWELNESVSTVKRRHRAALGHVKLPEDCIRI